MQHKLINSVYRFEKQFNGVHIQQLEEKEEEGKLVINPIITIDLYIHYSEDKFHLDQTEAYTESNGILLVGETNTVGNLNENAHVVAEYYSWIADICRFANSVLYPAKVIDGSEALLDPEKILRPIYRKNDTYYNKAKFVLNLMGALSINEIIDCIITYESTYKNRPKRKKLFNNLALALLKGYKVGELIRTVNDKNDWVYEIKK